MTRTPTSRSILSGATVLIGYQLPGRHHTRRRSPLLFARRDRDVVQGNVSDDSTDGDQSARLHGGALTRIQRQRLTILSTRLYDRGDDEFVVEHPFSEIGDLLRVELDEHDACTIRFLTDIDDYTAVRQGVVLC